MQEQIMRAPPRVLFAGGGTGGHLFPGIAVGRAFVDRYRDARVVFAGTGRGVEARALAREDFTFERVRSAGLVGESPAAILRAMALAPVTLLDAARVLRRTQPDLVIGLGGYSAGPLVLLGALSGRPTMILEQNAVPGLTNRLLAPFVRTVAVSFGTTAAYFGPKAFVSGNPVRQGFFAAQDTVPHRAERPHVLVVGGSQGAHSINEAMTLAAPILAAVPGGISITHQTGESDLDAVRTAYRRAGLGARVEPFFEEMEDEMHAADVVICRAGATTLAEVAAAGRPALIVPLPYATHDHQRLNAAVVADAGAGEVIEQADIDTRLTERLVALVNDSERRRVMSEAARQLAKPGAADAVVMRAEQLIGRAAPK